jgi:hypothetical protein
LEPFTVFVGPNASGKSSILQGLDLLCRVFHRATPDVMKILTEAMSRQSQAGVELTAKVAGRWYRFRAPSSISPGKPQRHPKANWSGDLWGETDDPNTGNWKEWKNAPNSRIPLPLSVLLRLEASNLALPKRSSDPTTMAPDGTGLHSALANMALNEPDTWQQLQADLRRIIPTIRRLRHTKSMPNQPSSLLFDTVGADSVPAYQVSEGTLLVLGMLAAIHASKRPSLILFDDLDRGLHPKAQKEVINFLRGLLEANSGLQIVATTHSPYVLDCVNTHEVRLTFLKEDGATLCSALTRHPEFPKWKEEMTPGEMWSVFGEKWLAEEATA